MKTIGKVLLCIVVWIAVCIAISFICSAINVEPGVLLMFLSAGLILSLWKFIMKSGNGNRATCKLVKDERLANIGIIPIFDIEVLQNLNGIHVPMVAKLTEREKKAVEQSKIEHPNKWGLNDIDLIQSIKKKIFDEQMTICPMHKEEHDDVCVAVPDEWLKEYTILDSNIHCFCCRKENGEMDQILIKWHKRNDISLGKSITNYLRNQSADYILCSASKKYKFKEYEAVGAGIQYKDQSGIHYGRIVEIHVGIWDVLYIKSCIGNESTLTNAIFEFIEQSLDFSKLHEI